MSDEFFPGDLATLKSTFTDKVTGQPIDPSSVQVTVKDPTGAVNVYTPAKESTGVYTYDLSLPVAGVYYYRFAGTGAATGAEEDTITVSPSSVINRLN